MVTTHVVRLKLFRLKAEGGQKSTIAVLWRKYLPAIASSGEAGGSDSCTKHGFKMRFFLIPRSAGPSAYKDAGSFDPANPRIYNDVSIALLAMQIGAVVVTTNISDFKKIHQVVDFKFRKVM